MKNRTTNAWFYGSLITATWMFGTIGLYLLGTNHDTVIAWFLLISIPLLWGLALTGGASLVGRASFEQLKGVIIFSTILFLIASLLLMLIVILTPNDSVARGSLFFWEKLISYGSLLLTVAFVSRTWYLWKQEK